MKEDIVSPNGEYKISFSSYQVSMSHWIDQAYQTASLRVSDNVCLFSLNEAVW